MYVMLHEQVIVGTLMTAGFDLDDRFHVPIVGEIPKG